MVGGSRTFTVRRGETVFGRCCYFTGKQRSQGSSWDVYSKAQIHGRYQVTDAVVKVSSEPGEACAHREVDAQMKKFAFATGVLRNCRRDADGIDRLVNMVQTFYSEIDKLSKGCNKRQKHSRATNGQRGSHMCEGAHVLVQDFVQGVIKDLLVVEENCRVPPTAAGGLGAATCLSDVIHESYRQSGGQCVIAGLKGVAVRDKRTGAVTTYHVTSLTVHSLERKFGATDKGAEGVELYKRWSGLSRPLPRSQPSAPPPEENDNNSCCNGRGGHRCVADQDWPTFCPQASSPPDAPPPFPATAPRTNNIFTASQLAPKDWRTDAALQVIRQLLDTVPEFRRHLPEARLGELMGPPPAYSFVDNV